MVQSPALRYHGGKFRMALWVMQYFPPHRCYVEPYGGAAGVLLQKARSYAEVYNDLNGELFNFFSVLRDPVLRERLAVQLVLTPYSRQEFLDASKPCLDPVERARRLCVRSHMSFGSGGASGAQTGFRSDTKREYSTAQHVWAQYPDSIAVLGARLCGVLLENQDALKVMTAHDASSTLHYVDPPYMQSTRKVKRSYADEMSLEQHEEMLGTLRSLKGFVVLSGYANALYDDLLTGWRRVETQSFASSDRGAVARTECLWINPACHEALHGGDLFQSLEQEANVC